MAVRSAALVTLTTASAWALGGLWLDSRVDRGEQLLLGALTAVVFAALMWLHTPAVRLQALGVVGFANIPAFVPPGHGLVYLAGFSVAVLLGRRVVLAIAVVGAAGWGIAGLTLLPAPDASGAIGCAFLVAVLLWTRIPVYAGVFLAVAVLELYGTAIGTWRWEAVVPGLGLSQGNPPSGVASGYVVFDICALLLSAQVLRMLRRRRGDQPMRPRIAEA
jgi:hypothetical protein